MLKGFSQICIHFSEILNAAEKIFNFFEQLFNKLCVLLCYNKNVFIKYELHFRKKVKMANFI